MSSLRQGLVRERHRNVERAAPQGHPPEYAFYYRAGNSATVLIRDWGSSTYDWPTAAMPAGAYSIYSFARAQGNTDYYDSEGVTSYVFQ